MVVMLNCFIDLKDVPKQTTNTIRKTITNTGINPSMEKESIRIKACIDNTDKFAESLAAYIKSLWVIKYALIEVRPYEVAEDSVLTDYYYDLIIRSGIINKQYYSVVADTLQEVLIC